MIIKEIKKLIGKERYKIIRLIIEDLFNRNIDIIDEHNK